MLGVLGGLYLVQGIVWGFGGLLLLPRLAAAGVPLVEQTGILAIAGAPWVLKLAWGPVLDTGWARRVGAGRIAAAATLLVAAALAAMATLDPPAAHTFAVAVAWLLLNVALSLQDVSTDALAFDAVALRSRGRAMAVMLAGHHVGAELLAGAVVGAVVASRGLPAGLLVLASASALVAIAVAITTPRSGASVTGVGAQLRPALMALVRARRGRPVLAFAALVFAADVLTSAVSGAWFVELGWSPEDAVARVVLVLLVGNLAGYASAAVWLDRVGRVRALQASCALLGAVWIIFAATRPWWAIVGWVQGFVAVQSFVTAWLYAACHAVLMDATAPRLRATQFAILTACLNLPRVWAPALGAPAIAALGFGGTFAACGVWQLAMAMGAVAVGFSPPRVHDADAD